MLTRRQNMLETIRGGQPDRFVNQFDALELVWGDPFMTSNMSLNGPGSECVNGWGVTIRFQENTPGPFPVHDDAHKVVRDITKWRETVKAPNLDFPQEAWDAFKPMIDNLDRNEKFVTSMIAPGVFEQLHYLMGMDDCLVNFYAEPEDMKALIDYITDWEMDYAKLLCENYHPDAILHHDDWGSQRSSFLSPDMFNEFIVPSYKKIYGYYKAHGVELIVHHSDSYAANLVPHMIDMGIDVFQGCINTNNVPDLIQKYGGQISFMGALNNGIIDVHDWTDALIASEVEKACRACGTQYFIPCCTAGGPGSTYPGVYEAVTREIDKMSKVMF